MAYEYRWNQYAQLVDVKADLRAGIVSVSVPTLETGHGGHSRLGLRFHRKTQPLSRRNITITALFHLLFGSEAND